MSKDDRTLYTKYNLAVAEVASRDAKDIMLHRVHFAPDGSTVASNGRALLAVSPPNRVRAQTFPELDEGDARPDKDGVGLTLEDVTRVKRNFPNDRRPSLQYAQMIRCTKIAVALLTTDGKTRQVVKGHPARGTFPKWKGMIAKARRKATRAHVCVDRQSLIKLLQAVDKACPDRGGYNPVFLEIGGPDDAIVIRARNHESVQEAVGMLTPLSVVEWPDDSAWEKESFGKKPRKARRIE